MASLSCYQPGKTIKTRRMLLQAADYYLRENGPLYTDEIYNLLGDLVLIKGMNQKKMALLMGNSGLFQPVEKNRMGGRLWTVPR